MEPHSSGRLSQLQQLQELLDKKKSIMLISHSPTNFFFILGFLASNKSYRGTCKVTPDEL